MKLNREYLRWCRNRKKKWKYQYKTRLKEFLGDCRISFEKYKQEKTAERRVRKKNLLHKIGSVTRLTLVVAGCTFLIASGVFRTYDSGKDDIVNNLSEIRKLDSTYYAKRDSLIKNYLGNKEYIKYKEGSWFMDRFLYNLGKKSSE